MHATQRKRCQARARPQKKACRYGVFVSGKTIGEYDNGSALGAGRTEYIWLSTDDGSAIPVGIFRNGKFFAIHTDHLGTPRLMTNEANTPVWQWPYSAFGSNKPTGVLKATPNPKAAITNIPVLLKATAAVELNLGFPGWYRDVETNAFYNHQRDVVSAVLGRYFQPDPIGTAGGLNRFAYVDGNPLSKIDPKGLAASSSASMSVPAPAANSGADQCVASWRDDRRACYQMCQAIGRGMGGVSGQAFIETCVLRCNLNHIRPQGG